MCNFLIFNILCMFEFYKGINKKKDKWVGEVYRKLYTKNHCNLY